MKNTPKRRPVMLMILDGWGLSKETDNNAVYQAETPNLDRLAAAWPTTKVNTSGLDVGLPLGQMGNSEVGHTNIGAGRIVYQDLTRISKDMESGAYLSNPAFLNAINQSKEHGSALHLIGLLSDGGVHSHIEHLFGLLDLAAHHQAERVFIHALYDGRDVSPTSGLNFTAQLLDKMAETGTGQLATISGRYYAMDRDRRWERVEKAYLALVQGSEITTSDPLAYIADSYEQGITDEFLLPATVLEDGKPTGLIEPNDSVIFFNFRPDRARELTRSLMQPDFDNFRLPYGHFPLHFVTMTEYDVAFDEYPGLEVAYAQEDLDQTLGQYISELGLRQLRIAETEKYAHVTFFFNGGAEKEFPGEDRVLIPSPKVATYDLQPEMSAPQVTEEVLRRLESDAYDLIILNYANCDMVGHTGVFSAAVAAVETVDKAVGKITDLLEKKGGIALITSDHGNAEQMHDPQTDGVFTAHTTNPVPLIGMGVVEGALRPGRLCDLAPTILDLMGFPKPEQMTGKSLLERYNRRLSDMSNN